MDDGTRDIARMDDLLHEQKAGRLFQSPGVFSAAHIPSSLLFRRQQVEAVLSNARCLLDRLPAEHLHIFGGPGTGKTAMVRGIVDGLNAAAEGLGEPVSYVYVNTKHLTYPKVLYQVARFFKPEVPRHGVGSDVYMTEVTRAAKMRRCGFFFDDVDRMLQSYPHLRPVDELANDFSRLGERGVECFCGVISNNKNILKENLRRETDSSFCPTKIHCPQYSAGELSEILYDRCQAGFQPDVVSWETMAWFGEMLFNTGRDLRTGMRTLLAAGKEAGRRGLASIDEAILGEALSMVEKNELFEIMRGLDDQALLYLYSIGKVQYARGNAPLDDVMRVYRQACDRLGVQKCSRDHLRQYIRPRLEQQDLFSSRLAGRGRGKGRTLVFEIHPEEAPDMLLAATHEMERREMRG
ncbi:MAG: AAA family ATPase [Candidatus Thermoplasmatota archaeon]|nr:AAA family ATPase [Candidatus Thermoplasmatota archaeon]